MADNTLKPDMFWLAGILEGEGCFCVRSKHNPIIQLIMSDMDIVIKAASLMGAHKVVKCSIDKRYPNKKQLYRTVLYGKDAIDTMMLLYPLMGERRKKQIEICLLCAASKDKRQYPERKPYSRGAEIVWYKKQEVA